MIINFSYQSLGCHLSGNIIQIPESVDISIQNASLGINQQALAQTSGVISTTIPAFSMDAQIPYQIIVNQIFQNYIIFIQFSALLQYKATFSLNSEPQYQEKVNVDLQFILTDLYISLGNSNRQVDYRNQVIQKGIFRDFEIDNTQNPPDGITKIWSCIEISFNIPCKDRNGVLLTFVQNLDQIVIDPYTFSPYTAVSLTVIGTKPHLTSSGTSTRSKTSSIILFFTEMDMPPLTVILEDKLNIDQIINENQIIHAELLYDTTTDINLLFYTGAIIYQNVVVGLIKFQYPQLRFQISDYYSSFLESSQDVQIRFSVYNPMFVLPSLATIQFTLNFPPVNCVFTAIAQTTPQYAGTTLFNLNMNNCVDTHTPISYQFFYYESQIAYDKEKRNPLMVQRKQLNDISLSSTLTLSLPAGNIVLLAQAIDSRNAIVNATLSLNLSLETLTSSQYISFFDNKMSIISIMISEDQIVNLSLLGEDLLTRGVSLMTIEEMSTRSLLIVKKLQIASSLILSSSQMNQLVSQTVGRLLESPFLQVSSSDQAEQVSILKNGLTQIAESCVSSQVSQIKYQKCIENIYLSFKQIDALGVKGNSNDNNLNSNFISLSETIGTMISAQLLPNEDPVTYKGALMTIKCQKITDRLVSSYTGLNRNRLLLQSMRTLGSTINNPAIYNAITNTYSRNLYSEDPSFQSYTDNLAKLTDNKQMTTTFPVINPSLKNSDTGTPYDPERGTIHFFQNLESKTNLTCINKPNSKKEWLTSSCSTSINPKTLEIQCICPDISPVTIVQDLTSLFTENENINTAFGTQGLDNLFSFTNFYEYASFWILLSQTIFFIGFIIRGMQLDVKDSSLQGKLLDSNSENKTKSELVSLPVIKKGESRTINQSTETKYLESCPPLGILKQSYLQAQHQKNSQKSDNISQTEKKVDSKDSSTKQSQLVTPVPAFIDINFSERNIHPSNSQMGEKQKSINNHQIKIDPINECPENLSLIEDQNQRKNDIEKAQHSQKQVTLQEDDIQLEIMEVNQNQQQQKINLAKLVKLKQKTHKLRRQFTEDDKQKITGIRSLMYFAYFHEFISIFLISTPNISRSVRFVIFYLRYEHTLVISIIFKGIASSIVQSIFISIFNSVTILVLANIIIVLFKKAGCLKKFGLGFILLLITFYLYLILSITSGKPPSESNSFILSYAIFLIIDIIFAQTLTALFFGVLAKRVILSKKEGGLLYKLFTLLELNIIIQTLIG